MYNITDCEGNHDIHDLKVVTTPGDERLVVINLRGAMDGIDAVQPYGDKNLRTFRRSLSLGPAGGAHDLDGYFALHKSLGGLMPLWNSAQMAVIHSVCTPYRNKRSHFDGQDILETGQNARDRIDATNRTGWLNRLVANIPGARETFALSAGGARPLISVGSAPFTVWDPKVRIGLTSPDITLLQKLYENSPTYLNTFNTAIATSESLKDISGAITHANFVAAKLKEDARIATFSISGWDSHANQQSMLDAKFKELSDAILAIKNGVGNAIWAKTVVIVITEFGRTARQNGSDGTDHGTASMSFVCGGSVRGRQIVGRWAGLGNLYMDRDLMPTSDIRSYLAMLCHAMYGIPISKLETEIFPGLDITHIPGVI